MDNYGLPLRFKAVDTVTGECFQQVGFSDSWSDTFEHSILFTGDKGVSFFNIKIRQSTGYKDKNGTEIFFGDVCADEKGRFFNAETYEHSTVFREILFYVNGVKKGNWYGFQCKSGMVVIGNIHTPPEKLKANAEKVSEQ